MTSIERHETMNINIICVGKLKEQFWQDACAEYAKRLGSYCSLNIIELKDEKLPKNASPADRDRIIQTEGKAIIDKIGQGDYVIAMAIDGKMIDSIEFSKVITNLKLNGKSTIDFIIGGSYGLSNEVLKHADMKLSLSKMTFPHQMARPILLEQIYRACKIANNEVYHK